MKFLIDTNIFIPLEPTSEDNFTERTTESSKLAQAIQTAGHQIYVHPDQQYDIERDPNDARRGLRKTLFTKYPVLPASPTAFEDLSNTLGSPDKGTNDWVDNQLIIALFRDAVDYLVTDDKKLRNKAGRLGLLNRVWTLPEAIEAIQILFDETPQSPPAVQNLSAFELDETDKIFDSFRNDYEGFDNWLRKCRLEHRQAWIIQGNDNIYAAVCIVNPEKKDLQDLSGRKLKICTFKVSDDSSGFHFGELLLKTIFQYAARNSYDWLYISVFPKYDILLTILSEFGFEDLPEKTGRGEIKLLKQLTYSESESESTEPLEFFRLYGPYSFKLSDVRAFIVPIKPEFHQILFPDAELSLFPGVHPFGNSIRKAYLSNAVVRQIKPADILLFYQSEPVRGISTIGVVEDTNVLRNPDDLVRFVGKRTVYSYSDITDLCERDVLAILFWHSGILNEPVFFHDLMGHEIISGPPQSIQSLPEERLSWLHNEIIERLPYYQSSHDL